MANLARALRAAQLGDERGFAVLWRELQPALLRYLRVVSGDAAEDVASETWLQVSRDITKFTGDLVSFRVWLFRIARHRAIDERRRRARRPSIPCDLSDPPTDWPPAAPAAPDAADEAVRDAGTRWALGLIASLPPDQAEAVMLRVVAGLTATAAGELLGKRPGAVRVASMRGLRRLSDVDEVRARRAVPAR